MLVLYEIIFCLSNFIITSTRFNFDDHNLVYVHMHGDLHTPFSR